MQFLHNIKYFYYNNSMKKYSKNLELNKLLDESLISFYWLGFILADGHLTNKRLRVVLSGKDEDHLLKLANFLNTKIKYENVGNYPYIDLSNKLILSNLKIKYSIKDNKTKNPPDISQIKGNNLKALAIGFIDGDGSIGNLYNRPDFHIRIKVHSSWINVLKYMYGKCYINNSGYAETVLSNTEEVKKWKIFIINNELPTLKRKWDIINLNYISRQELSNERKEIVQICLENNIPRKMICKITGLSKSGLSLLIKRNNLI